MELSEKAQELKRKFSNLSDSAKIEVIKLLRESLPYFKEEKEKNYDSETERLG